MSLREKLLLAQLPLALALLAIGALSVRSTQYLGSSSQAILKDNYRSVLACQRMKETLERVDSAAAFIALGERDKGEAQRAENLPRFEGALRDQAANITEVGEGEATAKLTQLWGQYRPEVLALGSGAGSKALYFSRLEPQFLQVKRAVDAILDLNQDAMVRKSEAASRSARQVDTLLVVATLLAFFMGGLASSGTTTRLLRPLSVLTQAARRVGKGDLEVRAVVEGRDEVAALASEFNEMAGHLRQYRQSSLGELLQAQSAAQSAIDSLPDAVVIFGMDGQVLAANTLAEGELHIALEAGAPLSRVEPALRAALEQVKAHVLAGRGPYLPRGFEEAIRSPGPAGERSLLARATPVYDAEGSGLRGATVVLQDVTRLRRFDELKNDLVATVAHEFRTPLTSLRMAIHLCLEGVAGELSEKQRDLLQAGREDCERLQGIVDDLLDLSKLQSGHEALRRAPRAASALLAQAAEAIGPVAQERRVDIRTEDLADGASVLVDAERLQLVFSNLLTNAVRHTPEGAAVTLRALPGAGHVRFEVHDAGPGVSPEFQARIFEKYFRAPGGQGGAAGLGLYISKEIVAAHGGEIGVVSEPGQGSTFWFTVPQRAPT